MDKYKVILLIVLIVGMAYIIINHDFHQEVVTLTTEAPQYLQGVMKP